MLLASEDGASIELRVLRYQYPDIAASGDRDWDANWLVIRGDVRAADGEVWSFTDPCLTTWEAQELAAWLRDAADARITPSEAPTDSGELFSFTEPNLAFSVAARDSERVVIRVHLSLECVPPSQGNRDYRLYEFHLPISSRPDDLRAAADAWDEALRRYPVR